MPSGDSAQAAVWACVLGRAFSSYAPFVLIPCTMFARVFYGAHWVGDTIVGAVVGSFIEFLCNAVLQRWCTPPDAGGNTSGSAFAPGSYMCSQ
jgi:membrane-associated phospholipid phosphatase